MKQMKVLKIVIAIVVLGLSSYNVYKLQGKDINVSQVFLSQIEAIAGGEISGGNTSCTATYTCVDAVGDPTGSVSCTGSVCKRGTEKEGIIFTTSKRYVECDGKRTYC